MIDSRNNTDDNNKRDKDFVSLMNLLVYIYEKPALTSTMLKHDHQLFADMLVNVCRDPTHLAIFHKEKLLFFINTFKLPHNF